MIKLSLIRPPDLTALCCLLFADVRPGRTDPRKRSVPVGESHGQRETASGRRVHHQSDHSGRERQFAGFRQSGAYIVRIKCDMIISCGRIHSHDSAVGVVVIGTI